MRNFNHISKVVHYKRMDDVAKKHNLSIEKAWDIYNDVARFIIKENINDTIVRANSLQNTIIISQPWLNKTKQQIDEINKLIDRLSTVS